MPAIAGHIAALTAIPACDVKCLKLALAAAVLQVVVTKQVDEAPGLLGWLAQASFRKCHCAFGR